MLIKATVKLIVAREGFKGLALLDLEVIAFVFYFDESTCYFGL